MRCFKCKNPIHKDDHHFKFDEYFEGKKVRTDYCHKSCWDEIKSALNVNTESMSMLKGMRSYLNKLGIVPDQVVNI